MDFSIISIIVNAIFFVVLNLDIYTDRAPLADGSVREWHRSPLGRLEIADERYLFYLQILFAAVSIITSILVMVGIKNNVVKIIRLVATIASAVMFIIIMVTTNNTHAKY